MNSLAQGLALRPLVLRALRQLSDRERKELVVLYSLTGDLNENHEILSALDKDNKLSGNRDCLELFIVNLEAIGSQNEMITKIIEEARQKKEQFEQFQPVPFLASASPVREESDTILLTRATNEPEQEGNRGREHISQMVAGDKSSQPTITLASAGELDRQNKRPRLESSYSGPVACDSTYNSEESETEDADQESDPSSSEDEEPPKPATGDHLKFITQARKVAMNSPDPHTKVGAIVVSKEGRVIGEGYNFLPRDDLSWNREAEKEEDTKYPFVTHAAVTAIQNAYKSKEDPTGATLYTTLFPSSRDGVFIYTSGIAEVVFLESSREWRKRYSTGATKKLFDGKIPCRQVYIPETRDSLD